MAYTKRTWLGRQGTGLNKFSIDGATPVTIVNQPDSVTQVGDALSAGNLNDLEDRIEDAFDDVDTALGSKADETEVTNLNNAITQLDHRLENLEQAKGDYIVSAYKDGSTTPSGKGNWAVVEGLRGVSRVENNQLPNISTFNTYQVTKGATVDNVLTVSNITGINAQVYCNCPIPLGRTVLAGVYLKPSVQTTAMLVIGSQKFVENVVCPANTWTFLGNVITISGTADYFSIYPNRNEEMGSADSAQIKLVGLTDLNVYFGGSIPSDAQTLADIQKNYSHLLLPSDYGTRIVDWTGNGVRAWARNLWDEEWLNGYYNYGSGEFVASSQHICSENYIPVRGGVTYYSMQTGGYVCYYDKDKVFISSIDIAMYGPTFTPPANCAFIMFNCGSAYGATYQHNICINQSDSQNGTYTPWHAPSTLSFPSTSLKSAGSVREKKLLNVEVEIDGQKVQKSVKTNPLGEQDLSEIAFTYNSTFASWRSNSAFSLAKPPASNDDVANIMLAGFIAIKGNDVASTAVMSIAINIGGNIWVNNGSSTTPPSGTMRYELATPNPVTLSDPILDNTLLTESGGRMATVQTGTVVDGSFDMGFITL